MNFKFLENEYSNATQAFFYNIFDEILNSEYSNNIFVVFVARRCFVLSRLYLYEYINVKNLDNEAIKKLKSHIYTDSAFRILTLTLAEQYHKSKMDFKIFLCDDILIHGRSIGELLSSAESLFITKSYEVLGLLKKDYDFNEELSKKFLEKVTIKTIFRNNGCFLLHSRFLPCLEKLDSDYILPPSKWRKISYVYSRIIAESNIPNVTFVSSVLRLDETVHGFLSKILSTDGFLSVKNEYLGRKLNCFIRVLNQSDDVKSLYTIRITEKYIVPFFFLPEISYYKFNETQKSIFSYLISVTKSENAKNDYKELEKSLIEFDQHEESSVCSIQFMNLFLSLNLLRCFLDIINLNGVDKSVLYKSLDYDLIAFNYCHNETVISLARRIMDINQKPILKIEQLDSIIFKALSNSSILENYTKQLYPINSESIDYNALEKIAFDYAIESETKAYHLERGSLEPSDSSIKEFSYPEKKSLERFFIHFYESHKKEAISIEKTTASILQLMDAGILAASASRNRSRCLFYLRSSEQALTTIPYRYVEFIPFLYEIEKYNPSQSANLQYYYLRELKYFLDEKYTNNIVDTHKKFLAELRENQRDIIELIKQVFSSFQSFESYLFLVLYKYDQDYLDEFTKNAEDLYNAVMF